MVFQQVTVLFGVKWGERLWDQLSIDSVELLVHRFLLEPYFFRNFFLKVKGQGFQI